MALFLYSFVTFKVKKGEINMASVGLEGMVHIIGYFVDEIETSQYIFTWSVEGNKNSYKGFNVHNPNKYQDLLDNIGVKLEYSEEDIALLSVIKECSIEDAKKDIEEYSKEYRKHLNDIKPFGKENWKNKIK